MRTQKIGFIPNNVAFREYAIGTEMIQPTIGDPITRYGAHDPVNNKCAGPYPMKVRNNSKVIAILNASANISRYI